MAVASIIIYGSFTRERRNEGRENQYRMNFSTRGRHIPTRNRPEHGGNVTLRVPGSCDSGNEYAHNLFGYFTFSVLFDRIKLATVLLRGWLALKNQIEKSKARPKKSSRWVSVSRGMRSGRSGAPLYASQYLQFVAVGQCFLFWAVSAIFHAERWMFPRGIDTCFCL